MSHLEEIRQQFKKLDTLDSVKDFLDLRAARHNNYFHYTSVTALRAMLQSKKLHLSLGKTMNDLFEIQKIDPEKWERLYVASFSFTSNESVALWHIYGNPFNQAIRIQFSRTAVLKMLEKLKNCLKCKDVSLNERYYDIRKAGLVDIAYVQNDQKSLRWNKALLSDITCPQISRIHEEKLAGYIKNVAWEYEMETRLLVELGSNDKFTKFPDKIQIDAEELWIGAKILCGPCLSAEKFKNTMEEFFARNPSAIKLNLEYGKNLDNSILLNRVYFKSKCEKCDTRRQCGLLKQIENNHVCAQDIR